MKSTIYFEVHFLVSPPPPQSTSIEKVIQVLFILGGGVVQCHIINLWASLSLCLCLFLPLSLCLPSPCPSSLSFFFSIDDFFQTHTWMFIWVCKNVFNFLLFFKSFSYIFLFSCINVPYRQVFFFFNKKLLHSLLKKKLLGSLLSFLQIGCPALSLLVCNKWTFLKSMLQYFSTCVSSTFLYHIESKKYVLQSTFFK